MKLTIQRSSFLALLCSMLMLATISPVFSTPTFKWKHDVPARIGPQALSPDQSVVYAYVGLEPNTEGNYIRAISTETGETVWEIEAPGKNQKPVAVGQDGTIYGPNKQTQLYVDDVDTSYRAWAPGETTPIWIDRVDTDASKSRASPAVHNRKNIVYLPYQHVLKAVDADSGTDLGTFRDFPTGSKTGIMDRMSPVITPDHQVIFGAGSSDDVAPSDRATPQIISVKYDSSAPSGFQEEWRYEPQGKHQTAFALNPVKTPPHVYFADTNTVYALDMQTGEERWTYELDGRVDAHDVGSFPVVGPDGTLYIGDSTEKLYAISPVGTTRWVTSLNVPNGERSVGTPTVARSDTGTMIFVGTDHDGSDPGRLVALNEKGEILWKRKQPAPEAHPDKYFWEVMHPPNVLEDGTVVVFSHQSNDKIWALETAARGVAHTPWPMTRHNTMFDAESDTTTSSSTDDGSSSEGSSCLIGRTAPTAVHDDLRRYRDVLLASSPGRYLVQGYYRYLGGM